MTVPQILDKKIIPDCDLETQSHRKENMYISLWINTVFFVQFIRNHEMW